jgi:hypothetical protein
MSDISMAVSFSLERDGGVHAVIEERESERERGTYKVKRWIGLPPQHD